MRPTAMQMFVLLAALTSSRLGAEEVTPHLHVIPGAVNSALIEDDETVIVVYGATNSVEVDHLLLTHHRRDVVTSARRALKSAGRVYAPEAERDLFEKPGEWWTAFLEKRFHDYAQQSTKVLARPVEVDTWVKAGSEIEAGSYAIRVLDTPGFTRGAVSYIAQVDDKSVAFTGDLIYGDGQLFDLYSFQDAIPEAKIGGYHGHASRLAQLIPSLRSIAAEKPDIIVPARGPVIHNPQEAIDKLVGRVQAYYANYLSTNALNWYFKEERMTIKGRRVLGEDADVKLMPYSLYQDTPDWIWENSTSRMLISDDGHGFLLDCGNQRVIDGIKKLMKDGLVEKVDGIFVTHYHDDHTNMVQAASEEFDCPIYSTVEYEEILENPGGYHMPAMTHNPMPDVTGLKHGHTMKWKEYELEFHYYPGQAIHHGALLVRRENETPVYFVGDAFSPSGMDDYCLLNRNLVGDGLGYLYCLDKVRELGEKYWLINEHIPHVFRFSPKELDYLETTYRKRIDILKELTPWDGPNYGIDEQWAVLYPRVVEAKPGETVELQLRLTNHSPERRTFSVKFKGSFLGSVLIEPSVAPGLTVVSKLKFKAPRSGQHLITTDIDSEGMHFRDWSDALLTVE